MPGKPQLIDAMSKPYIGELAISLRIVLSPSSTAQ